MKVKFYLLFIILMAFLLPGCNTLYNYRLINIEVVEPGKLFMPEKYSTAAVVYANTNTGFNPEHARYIVDSVIFSDTINYDSIASEVYYYSFLNNTKNQFYFDSIIELNPIKFLEAESSGYTVQEKMNTQRYNDADTVLFSEPQTNNSYFGQLSETQLKRISDSTKADILILLDFFASADARSTLKVNNDFYLGGINVYSSGFWNFYDLKKMTPLFYFNHSDTIGWAAEGSYSSELKLFLPSRKDAILNAAEISGEKFAAILAPHWTSVERLYYISGQTDLIHAEKLVSEGKWQEAAELWEMHINNPNKKIAAKCLYNLGVASEMAGDFDTAISWVVKSYHIFGNRNLVHSENCQEYIRILGQRKIDLKIIETQISPVQTGFIQ